MRQKIICLCLCFMMIFTLCGCDFMTADTAELLSPPELSGDMHPISEVVEETAPDGYIMKYPSRGNYRSAVIREDINGDGSLEAFAFYSVTDKDVITMYINAICLRDGEWTSAAVQQIVAAGVDKVEFCDLDRDGVKEILVGWQIYGTSEMQLAIYSLGENALTQRIFQQYTHFTVCDLDENDINEVLIIKTGSAEPNNTAALYSLNESGVTAISSCELDCSVKTVNEPVVETLSTGKPAVYIDMIKGVGAVTEVLFMEKGSLVNPLFDAQTGETLATLRSVSFNIQDINGDGVMEIPVQQSVPSVAHSDVNEKLYLTDWCSFNGEVLTNQMTVMMNVNDGYYLTISPKLIGKIAVLKDTENRIREIYSYNPEDMSVGTSLLYLRAVDKADWDSGEYKNIGAQEIMNDGSTVFICKISDTAVAQGFTIEYIRANFKLI